MSINLLGLDLSLTSTGYSGGGVQGVISSKEKGVVRLRGISQEIARLISEFKIDVVIVEGYSFASRSGQAFSIGELGGVVRLCLYELGIPYVEVPPTCRAKFATGRGNASKNEVISAVSARTGIVWENPGADDRCDAWILEEMGLSFMGKPRNIWPSQHVQGLEKVDWGPLTRVMEEHENKPN